MALLGGILQAIEDVVLTTMGDKTAYRKICGAALRYMPPEARAVRGADTVIDNAIYASK
jgi:hypothetical protein